MKLDLSPSRTTVSWLNWCLPTVYFSLVIPLTRIFTPLAFSMVLPHPVSTGFVLRFRYCFQEITDKSAPVSHNALTKLPFTHILLVGLFSMCESPIPQHRKVITFRTLFQRGSEVSAFLPLSRFPNNFDKSLAPPQRSQIEERPLADPYHIGTAPLVPLVQPSLLD